MNHLMVIFLKFGICLIAFGIGLDWFFEAEWTHILWFSGVTTIISYIVGDRILLERIGNRNSLIADFLLSYMIVWLFGSVLLENYLQIGWASIISASIITAGEIFVHRMLLRSTQAEKSDRRNPTKNFSYAMEAAEENEPFKEK
ncbi:YndM family protein [Calidifontibacillus erzurumensis]|uniref:YndM family protein n=1 Tax=Calidifontibacillus erzurumensis TaxID=2741433 RepID=A0A8J8KDQ9_9BACI|nr:YndM family protein [Calidifontibacillus erzurumensis]NSL50950.1 YndM family protein [Calidifontibacillus erzurumensis]